MTAESEEMSSEHWKLFYIKRGGKWLGLHFFFFKSLLNLLTILFLVYVLVFWLWDTWDLSLPTRDGTCTPCIGRRSLNHWTRGPSGPALLKQWSCQTIGTAPSASLNSIDLFTTPPSGDLRSLLAQEPSGPRREE